MGCVVCGLLLCLGLGIARGFIQNKIEAIALILLLAVSGLMVLAAVGVRVLGRPPERAALAAALERVDARFQDRLNTLLFLGRADAEARAKSFSRPIAEQATRVLTERAPPSPYRSVPSVVWFVAFLLMAAGVVLFEERYTPWRRLASDSPAPAVASKQPHPLAELALPSTNSPVQTDRWGEVRISDPGADLRVTKVDVVPLQIEVAANSDIKDVQWFSSVNGAGEQSHALVGAQEPRSAIFQPVLYLDELGLSDWDVVTYYAKAKTADQSSYASDIYFLEVRPFREDILKNSGGEGGGDYEALSEMTSLVGRQQHVIRDTHQATQRPAARESTQAQIRSGLSQTEGELAAAAQHLYAEMAATLEDQPIGDALEHLARAQTALEQASTILSNSLAEAQDPERSALADLVAARKVFQQAISENPAGLTPTGRESSPPVADSSQKLNQMAEFRDEAKSTEEFVQRTIDQQKQLEQKAAGVSKQSSEMAAQEQRLRRELEAFSREHPRPFQGSEPELAAAEKSLREAEGFFQSRAMGDLQAARQASQSLENLQTRLQGRSAGQRLAEAYRLKRMIEEQARILGGGARASDAEGQRLERAAEVAQAAIAQLRRNVERDPASAGFGQPLRDFLGGKGQDQVAQSLSDVLQARTDEERRQRAAAADALLQQLTKAFVISEPRALQEARQTDSLRPDPQAGLQEGLAELEHLLKQLEGGGKLDAAVRMKEGRQALASLQAGLRGRFGQNNSAEPVLAELQKMLAHDQPFSSARLKQLIEQLQRFSLETSSGLTAKVDRPEMFNVDIEHLPPRYRSQIERYFRRLSEQ